MMAQKKFHMGWFLNFTVDEWTEPHAGLGGNPWNGKFYVEVGQMLEKACFDYMMIEDKLIVSEAYGGTSEVYLKHGLMAPKHDPVPLATTVGVMTQKLGVVATISTLGYPPYLLARACSTIDSLVEGRFGWNIVTSAEDFAAQNFGMEKLPPREQRYEMADEYVDLVNQLFDSWDKDAVVLDRESRTYVDYKKVRPIHFKGKYYSCRGPLNTVPSPQHRPVYVQAGGSPRGRDFAAKHADSIIAVANGVQEMKAYREDIRARAAKHGRNPDDVKVLYLISPTVGATTAEAKEKFRRIVEHPDYIEQSLALISFITDIDFAQFDLDKPLPGKLTTNGESGSLDKFQQWGSGKTLRQLCVDEAGGAVSSIELVDSYANVAERMADAMAEVGGDGYLITSPSHRVSRRYVSDICEGVIPILQRRGVVRTEYTGKTLRETLREF
ncbi:FMN-dependent oxidoreductase, nitrilotriacetate monooxygenase family [Arboricoccus pini]|uniref:FMN-dependent oxidoreductase, nitrilotriacetate monooxygenase family n=2 Tax=Arboricoccus pini TaxID=1963835 RepID=A0A212S301_9PROT|nr:FMN-dependent oxidoreductase, nitrilotriacetate monooxygenase family [Arboricoccus pini]